MSSRPKGRLRESKLRSKRATEADLEKSSQASERVPCIASTRALFAIAATAIIAGLTACGASRADPAAGEARSSPRVTQTHTAATATPFLVATVFFVKGEQFAPRLRAVPPGKDAATVAVRNLLAGPRFPNVRRGSTAPFPGGPSSLSHDQRRNRDGRAKPRAIRSDRLRRIGAACARGTGRLHADRDPRRQAGADQGERP